MTGVACNTEGFYELARIYISIEGIETFGHLIKEIEAIEKAGDWNYFFENVSIAYDLTEMNEDKLKELARAATLFYHKNLNV